MEIRIYGDEVLNKRADEIAEITPEISELAAEMIKKCPEANGIGLAAPQVGVSIRLFVVFIAENEDEEGNIRKEYKQVFINPEIKKTAGSCKMEEGCLSVPGIWEIVERPEIIEVEFTDIEGKRILATYEGLMARVIQHENDHLDGILFVSKLPKLKQDLLKKRLNTLKNKKRDY